MLYRPSTERNYLKLRQCLSDPKSASNATTSQSTPSHPVSHGLHVYVRMLSTYFTHLRKGQKVRRSRHEPAAVCPECGCTAGVGYDITPLLQELQWFPVRRRVNFKMVTLVYMSLSDMAPAYLAADCQLVSDEWRPSSSAAFCHNEDVRW